ncbi:hypothetical protein ACFDTO_08290 [Microbacteriaceae bacterium 4G12]
MVQSGSWGIFWLLTFIGAAVYFISESDGSFLDVVLGLVRALVWPAYVVFHALEALGA